MSPLKETTKDCVNANKNQTEHEKMIDNVKRFIQKSRAEFQEISKLLNSERQAPNKTLSDTPSSANTYKREVEKKTQKTKFIEELPESIATKNTLHINPSEMEKLLGIPYPGHVHSLEDLQVKYTPQQRKQIYDHVIATIPTPEHLRIKALHEATGNEKLSFSSNNISKSSRHRYRSNRDSFHEELRCLIESQMQTLQMTVQVPTDNFHKESSKTKNVAVGASATAINYATNQSSKNYHTHDRDNNFKSPNKKQQTPEDRNTSSNRNPNRNTSPSQQYNNTSPKLQRLSYRIFPKRKAENQRHMQNRNRQHKRLRQNNDNRSEEETSLSD